MRRDKLVELAERKEPLERMIVPLVAVSDVPELNCKAPEYRATEPASVTKLPEMEAIVPIVPPEEKSIPGARLGVPVFKRILPPPTVKTDPVVLMVLAKFKVPVPVMD